VEPAIQTVQAGQTAPAGPAAQTAQPPDAQPTAAPPLTTPLPRIRIRRPRSRGGNTACRGMQSPR